MNTFVDNLIYRNFRIKIRKTTFQMAITSQFDNKLESVLKLKITSLCNVTIEGNQKT